jgi:glycosyltransferase involved in cell wall biosynthesis
LAEPGVSIVVPTIGRPSLAVLLDVLVPQLADADDVELIVVDGGDGRGPAAARNTGWRAAKYAWVSFLDDDVVPDPDWYARLRADLAAVPTDVVGVQGRIRVPLPTDRRPTDWERVTAGLANGRWITADMAYRLAALSDVDGFDERFPRAFREDADLAYRLRRAGGTLAVGTRQVTHPVRAEGPWVSVRTQRGNADDALLRRRYGRRWREKLEVPPGRRPRHAFVTVTGLIALATLPARATRRLGVLAALGWLAGTAEFAWARIAPGPRTPQEVATMVATSALIPPLATTHYLLGLVKGRSPD